LQPKTQNSGFHAKALGLLGLAPVKPFTYTASMKRIISVSFLALFCALAATRAEQPDPHQVGVLDEKVSRLSAQVDDLQFQQQQMKKDIERLQAEVQDARRAAGGVAPTDLKALEDRIAAVDAARQADKKAIIDQLAKELAGAGKAPKPEPTTTGGKDHVVQKGETLTTIAKAAGVSVAELKKANDLTGDEIKVGQKLVIPK
jgi:predicted RNase H-like nuclease (RuvC/YqgF family)